PLIEQIARSERRLGLWATPIRVRAIVVDNGCPEPIDPERLSRPLDQLPVSVVRLDENAGGSGGFNRGISRSLLENPYNLVWLLDADTRITPITMALLAQRMGERPDLIALGAALADPEGSQEEPEFHEIGGVLNRRTGDLRPARRKPPKQPGSLVRCDYVASCCAMMRPDAIRETGLMPDSFLSADDASWMIRMAQRTGGTVAADPEAVAFHPRFSRFKTIARYYAARNALMPIGAALLSSRTRRRRAMTEVLRAINQELVGRSDLAYLHLLGLRDAWAGETTGRCPHPVAIHAHNKLETAPSSIGITASEARSSADLIASEPQGIGAYLRAVGRFLNPALRRIAAVPAKGGPNAWFRARKLGLISDGGISVVHQPRVRLLSNALDTYLTGRKYAKRLAKRAPEYPDPTPAPAVTRSQRELERPLGPLLSVVILTHNRAERLARTLEQLSRVLGRDLTAHASAEDEHEVIVTSNACTDDTRKLLRSRFRGVHRLALSVNTGVAGFNRGAKRAVGDYVLILDDDAWPDAEGLDAAIDLLETDRTLAAVALHPRHPETGRSEWPFDVPAGVARQRWPVMGSGNLVRRSDWLAAGGYEKAFQVYRNDTDLALKLLGMNRDVAFNPAWVVWHDSAASAKKPLGWFRRALRNWVWTGRRHAGLLGASWGIVLAWIWAHKAAGWHPAKHACTIAGLVEGLFKSPPSLPRHISGSRSGWVELVRLKTNRIKKPKRR
ncbi:MAG: glycosyltransferase, partial [Planctomycetota bacterium]